MNTTALQTKQARASLPVKQDCYTHHVQTFRTWMSEKGHDDPLSCIADYFRDLNASQYKAATIRMKRQAVKNRLRLWADAAHLSMDESFHFERLMKRLDTDPDTKAPKTATAAVKQSKILTPAEIELCILKSKSRKQQLFIKYLFATGARVSELTSVEIRNCHTEAGFTYITVTGKGRKERELVIPAELYKEIRAHFRGEEYLFETAGGKPYRNGYVSGEIRKLTRRVLRKPMGAHSLRHSFATHKYEEMPHKLDAISRYLGHSSVSTTVNMYVHSDLSAEDLFGSRVIAI